MRGAIQPSLSAAASSAGHDMRDIKLRRAALRDRPKIYRWLARSDATAEMMGPPKFPDHPVPGFAEFCADYDDAAFSEDGCFQIFIISIDGQEAGSVQFRVQERGAELDIWIADRRHWGGGIGSETLRRLAAMLEKRGDVDTLVIRPSARNRRAVAAYKKAGFEEYSPDKHALPRIFVEEGLDYHDAVVLARRLR